MIRHRPSWRSLPLWRGCHLSDYRPCCCRFGKCQRCQRPLRWAIPLATLLGLIEPLCRGGKLQAVDMVELIHALTMMAERRAAARLGWQIALVALTCLRALRLSGSGNVCKLYPFTFQARKAHACSIPFCSALFTKSKQEISEKLPAASGKSSIVSRLRQSWWHSMVLAE